MNSTTVKRGLEPILLAAMLILAGCSAGTPPVSSAARLSGPEEQWDAVFVTGKHVGHAVTKIESVTISGRQYRLTHNITQLDVRRFGGETSQTIEASSTEQPSGQVASFEVVMVSGDGRMEVHGERQGSMFLMSTTTGGETKRDSLEVPADCLGFFAVDQNLAAAPMSPGERRKLTQLVPMIPGCARVELSAADMEETKLLDGPQRLLRIDVRTVFPSGDQLETTLWTNATGEVLKTTVGDLQSTFRTTRQIAVAHRSDNLDIGTDLLVKVDKPIANPQRTKRIEYLARLSDGDPAAIFPQSRFQTVERVDDHVAKLTITASRLEEVDLAEDPDPADSPGFVASSMLQSDDPEIVAMAISVAPNESEPWLVSVELERFVHQTISKKNFSTALASAAEVAQSKAGDCTEHSVLLAALCRARKIPSRVAIGLIYHEPSSAFAYHMWTEVWIRGNWTPIDGTLGAGGVGACHLKVTDTDFSQGAGFDSFFPVLKLMGKLSLEVVTIEH